MIAVFHNKGGVGKTTLLFIQYVLWLNKGTEY